MRSNQVYAVPRRAYHAVANCSLHAPLTWRAVDFGCPGDLRLEASRYPWRDMAGRAPGGMGLVGSGVCAGIVGRRNLPQKLFWSALKYVGARRRSGGLAGVCPRLHFARKMADPSQYHPLDAGATDDGGIGVDEWSASPGLE